MAKGKGLKLPHFKVPLFEHTTVFFCPTREIFYEFCERAHIPIEPYFELAGGLTLTCTDENGGNFYVVAVFDNEVGTLTHEVAHATFHCLSDVGVMAATDPSHPANETYAYMIGRMFDAFYPVLLESIDEQAAAIRAQQALEEAERKKEAKRKAKTKEPPKVEKYIIAGQSRYAMG